MSTFLLMSCIAGVIAVDQKAGWQGLLAQPLFAAALVGAATGELEAALGVGLILELVWLYHLPVRGTRGPDTVAGAVTGAGTTVLLLHLTADPRQEFLIAVGVVVGLAAGEGGARVGRPFYALQRRMLSRVGFAPETKRNVMARRLSHLHIASVGYIFLVESVLVFAFLNASYLIAEFFTRHAGDALAAGATFAARATLPVGAASVIFLYWQPRVRRAVVLGAFLAVLVLWLH
jgi:mannose/fructose/N-acetylgalactosamine-specific phosphotransferase system component IIC